MSEAKPDGQGAHLLRRQIILVTSVLVFGVLSVGGLLADSFVRSPEQVRAEAGPPTASRLTAQVERKVLANTLVTRGTVEAESRLEVTPVVASAAAQVVTAINVKVGGTVKPGQVLLAVSGRPLIALPGKLPGYRDLKPGDSGADVKQLQRALDVLGHYRGGDPAGHFGAATKAAVRRLYSRVGYDVPENNGPDAAAGRAALSAAEREVESAHQAVTDLERRIAAGETAPAGAEPLRDQLTRLRQRLAGAQQARSELIAKSGPMLPLAEFVFVPSFPARVAALSAKVADQVRAPLITLAAGRLGVSVKLRPEQASLVRTGMPVKLASEALGQQVDAKVTSIGDLSAGDGEEEPPHHPAMLTPEKPLAAGWAGLDVRVTITAARTKAPVLVVPLSAVSAGADGQTTVSVVESTGQIRRVEVRPGISGDGFVEVTPVAGGLTEADEVVVGVGAGA